MRKICTKCSFEKEIDFFPWYDSHGLRLRRGQCYDCMNEAQRARRILNTDFREKNNATRQLRRATDPEWRERANSRRRVSVRPEIGERGRAEDARVRRKLDLLKVERGCYICGAMLPAECLDWDHLPGKGKRFNIGCDGPSFGLAACIDEIDKCQVVCSNCHRTLTKQRKLLEDK